jgi:hypothetical protein
MIATCRHVSDHRPHATEGSIDNFCLWGEHMCRTRNNEDIAMLQFHKATGFATEAGNAYVLALRNLSHLAEDISIYQTRMREAFDPRSPVVAGFRTRLSVVLRALPEEARSEASISELRAEIEKLLN